MFPGFIAHYRYSFALYNLYENPDMDIMEALNLSKRQTQGYKMELFKLDLSYMGWILLSMLPSLFFTSQAILTLGFSGMDPYAALAAPMPLWQILQPPPSFTRCPSSICPTTSASSLPISMPPRKICRSSAPGSQISPTARAVSEFLFLIIPPRLVTLAGAFSYPIPEVPLC